jgi:hypothetical protein
MKLLTNNVTQTVGRAIAQAVSRWLPTAAAWVRSWVGSCGICGGQSGTEGGFLHVLRSPLPIFIPLIPQQSLSSIIWGWYNRPVVACSTKWTQSYPTNNNKKTEKKTVNNFWPTQISFLKPGKTLIYFWQLS